MGIRLTQTAPDRPIEIYPDGKGDQHLAQYIARLIQQDIDYKEAREKDRGGKLEKAVATLSRPDGSTSVLSVTEAVQALQKAADVWQDRAMAPGLDRDLKSWLLAKAGQAKNEIRRLNGEDVPEEPLVKAAKPVSFTLPR
jgi:hypothetical protein